MGRMEPNPFKDRTEVRVVSPEWRLSAEDRSFCMGSCFAESFHHTLSNYFLNTALSGFGAIYNPVSLGALLTRTLGKSSYQKEDLREHNGLWRNPDFSTRFYAHSESKLLNLCNDSLKQDHDCLMQTNLLVLTLGTAWVYKEKKTGKVVNNCHKRPSGEFRRTLLNPREASSVLAGPLDSLLRKKPDLKIAVSVSPVRHLRDDPVENSRSKAVLHLAVKELEENLPLYYFPAYEILMDELRDYRWYAPDLIHPSAMAVERILNRFINTCADDDLFTYLQEARSLRRDMEHRLEFPDTPEAQKFIQSRTEKLEAFQQKYPFIKPIL